MQNNILNKIKKFENNTIENDSNFLNCKPIKTTNKRLYKLNSKNSKELKIFSQNLDNVSTKIVISNQKHINNELFLNCDNALCKENINNINKPSKYININVLRNKNNYSSNNSNKLATNLNKVILKNLNSNSSFSTAEPTSNLKKTYQENVNTNKFNHNNFLYNNNSCCDENNVKKKLINSIENISNSNNNDNKSINCRVLPKPISKFMILKKQKNLHINISQCNLLSYSDNNIDCSTESKQNTFLDKSLETSHKSNILEYKSFIYDNPSESIAQYNKSSNIFEPYSIKEIQEIDNTNICNNNANSNIKERSLNTDQKINNALCIVNNSRAKFINNKNRNNYKLSNNFNNNNNNNNNSSSSKNKSLGNNSIYTNNLSFCNNTLLIDNCRKNNLVVSSCLKKINISTNNSDIKIINDISLTEVIEATNKFKKLNIENPIELNTNNYTTNIPYEYLGDILYNLILEEKEYKYFYVNKHQKARAILLDWLVDVCDKFKLEDETYFLTVSILDRYISVCSHNFNKEIQLDQYQLIGSAALSISCKYEEILSPEIKDFVYITADTYSIKDILYYENSILLALNFKITISSSLKIFNVLSMFIEFKENFNYIHQLSKQNNKDYLNHKINNNQNFNLNTLKDFKDLGLYILYIFSLDNRSNNYLPSIVSYSILIICYKIKNNIMFNDDRIILPIILEDIIDKKDYNSISNCIIDILYNLNYYKTTKLSSIDNKFKITKYSTNFQLILFNN